MRYPSYHSILTNFDTSVILPFYKNLGDFEQIVPAIAPYLQRNGIEVIVVLNTHLEPQTLTSFIKQYPLINWIILVNIQSQSSRNLCQVINAGIKAASKRYIMVCSLKSKFQTDAIYRLRYMAEYYDPCFATGKVVFSGETDNTNTPIRALPNGNILVKKEYLEQIGGYAELFATWEEAEKHAIAKLECMGIKKIFVPDAVLINDKKEDCHFFQAVNNVKAPESYPLPNIEDSLSLSWDNSCVSIPFHYKKIRPSEELCRSYLRTFKKYEVCHSGTFSKRFKTVALIQTHNETQHVPEVLLHLDGICDGIILLDDESTDGTYELAWSQKLLIKAQKHRREFHDLENRNLLLDIASFVDAEWLFFLDADERLILWNSKLEELCSDEINAFCFYLVHLWDSDKTYRTDLPEQSPIGLPGILHRWRMFRNIGRLQITGNAKLHFKSTPYLSNPKVILPALIVHYGMLTMQVRERKYYNYLIEDTPERHIEYRYFLDDETKLAELDKLGTLNKSQFTLEYQ